MSRKVVLIVIVAVAVAILISFILLTLKSCKMGPPYEVESTQSSQEPYQYIVVDSTQIEQYPIIGGVIDAFDNPVDHPNAIFRDGTLYYAVYNESVVDEAQDYIIQRYRDEFGSSHLFPMNIAHDKGDGQGLQYFTWQVIAIDYDVPFYCA
jgi:hypothetical protein